MTSVVGKFKSLLLNLEGQDSLSEKQQAILLDAVGAKPTPQGYRIIMMAYKELGGETPKLHWGRAGVEDVMHITPYIQRVLEKHHVPLTKSEEEDASKGPSMG